MHCNDWRTQAVACFDIARQDDAAHTGFTPPSMLSNALQDIVCLFGYTVAGNPTQYVMERAFARAKLEWRYC